MSDNSLSGKVALVTGATRGIGKAIADLLAARGAVVVGTATTEEGAAQVREFLRSRGGEGLRLDVADQANIDAVFGVLKGNIGLPDILVNNAGIARIRLLMTMSDEDWQTVLDVNLTSVFRMSRACVRGMMKKRWGRIINITSVLGETGIAGQTNYCASKAGIVGFSKALAKEVGAKGITVNCVSPGFVPTDMTAGISKEELDGQIGLTAVKRAGATVDIANAVAYLCSSEASFITGESLHVNGGAYMG